MELFLCRTRQVQLRVLSNQLKRCYFHVRESSSVIRGTSFGVVNAPSLTFHRTGSEFGNRVRFFAVPAQAKPKYEEKEKGRPRMNKQIDSPYIRLVTDEGHGVVERGVALARAMELELDLVEVQPGNPPVCKLMDYNKEMYKKHVKEKEQTKKKSDLALRKGGLKEVRITYKIDKHDMQTKADTIKRLAERGYRIKCMAVTVPNDDKKQDLGELLSRLSALIEDFSLVESGPKVEAKQAYVVVRHVKFGPLKKGPGKKNTLLKSDSSISTQSPEEEQSLNESDSETEEDMYSEKAMELDSIDDFDQNHRVKTTPETSNRYAASRQTNGSENRYATTRPTNGSDAGVRKRFEPESQSKHQSPNPNNQQVDLNRRGPGQAASRYGMYDAPRSNNDPRRETRPVEVNRYQKGPRPQVPNSRGDFSRENTNMNPGGIRDKQTGFRR